MHRPRGDSFCLSNRVKGVQVGIAQVIKKVSVQLIGSRPRHRVYGAASGLAVFRTVIAGANLEFLNGVGAVDVGDDNGSPARFREKRLCVICSVHGVPVIKAGNSAEAAEAAGAIGGYGRGKQHKVLPAACGDRQSFHLVLAHGL